MNVPHVGHDVGIAFEDPFIESVQRSHRSIAETCAGDLGCDLLCELRTFGSIAALEENLDDFHAERTEFVECGGEERG